MASTDPGLHSLLDSWSQAIRDKDIDRLMALYAPDAVYFDVVPPLRIVGADAIRRNFLRWFGGWASAIGQDVQDLHVAAGGDVASVFMLLRASGTLNGGREVGYWVRATLGCRRVGGSWLIDHEHVSLPVELPAGTAAMALEP